MPSKTIEMKALLNFWKISGKNKLKSKLLRYFNIGIAKYFIFFNFRNEKREMQEMQEELEDLRDCGLGSCKPACLQPAANIKVFIYFGLTVFVVAKQHPMLSLIFWKTLN